ncbi:beta-glucoside bgl operon antiterminator, BglG family [Lachnospiraceae bacterium KM106-2]|nr:beta-glucoside bgl operon antiterminator, BglG family [Lachnospiraceae bacterium KM106-2]
MHKQERESDCFDSYEWCGMKLIKVINNNIISSVNDEGQEVVVMGRGIGFQAKPGQEIDMERVEKIFCMQDKKSSEQLQLILKELPLEHVQVSNDIVSYAKKQLGVALNENIYITLTDHISFAITRIEHGTYYRNALIWEIKKFYPVEFSIGKYAVELIKERLGVELGEDEAGSIALHIVNAEFNTTMNKAVDITKLIQRVLNIVKYYFKINIDEDDVNVERFITHLKFFAQRIVSNTMLQDEDEEFQRAIEKKYPEYYRCAEMIRELIKDELHYEITREEMMYITIHIGRIVREK